jgi:hypothetical protein
MIVPPLKLHLSGGNRMPKVENPSCCAGERLLPLPAVTLVSAAGCMRENPDASDRYSPFMSQALLRVMCKTAVTI